MIDAGTLLRTARLRAGLSQRELARRAGTAQSVIARIESGATSPSWDTLSRLVDAAGFAIDATVTVAPVTETHMLRDVARIRALPPEARLAELANVSAFLGAARRVSA
jgi:transcriptional regulator with XRE-family HTH domain